jgi:AcrR family transcriptional regulator
MPRTKQRTPALRDRLVEVAVATLCEQGARGLTTRNVAHGAATSPPALNELFGGKSGLVREVFFEGFRRLGDQLDALPPSPDPIADVVALVNVFREFARHNPELTDLMFSRTFGDFAPGKDELAAGRSVREAVVNRVRRCIESGAIAGDPTDIAHCLVALAEGLAGQERAGWLGTTAASQNRRWTLAVAAMLQGLCPDAGRTVGRTGR